MQPVAFDTVAALTEYGTSLVATLRDRIKTMPVTRFGPANNTGALAASLRVEVLTTATGYSLLLYAASYALALEYGRRPGKFPPLLAIRQWIESRGIVPHPDARGRAVSVNTLAFLIGRKIATAGTVLYQSGQPSGLFSGAMGPEVVAAALAALLLPVVVTGLRTALRPAAA